MRLKLARSKRFAASKQKTIRMYCFARLDTLRIFNIYTLEKKMPKNGKNRIHTERFFLV